jgi:hypothetical protein
MFIARGYGIHPETGKPETMPSVVMYGYSEKVLRRRMARKPGIREVKVATLNPQYEGTVIAEGLITR